MSEFVEAYAKSTGKKQWIPKHYLDHPVLGAGFSLTPSGREQQRVDDGPSLDWTARQLKDHADDLGVDRTGLRSKPDLLAAIEAHVDAVEPAQPGPHETPDPDAGQGDVVDGTPTTTDTPATGDDDTKE